MTLRVTTRNENSRMGRLNVVSTTCGYFRRSSQRTFRDGWGQRAWKDQPRSLGGPAGWSDSDQRAAGRHNRRAAGQGVGEAHSSWEAG